MGRDLLVRPFLFLDIDWKRYPVDKTDRERKSAIESIRAIGHEKPSRASLPAGSKGSIFIKGILQLFAEQRKWML